MKKLTVIFLCRFLASTASAAGKERDQGDLRWKYKHLLRNEGRYLVLQ